ncbi:MAG TPA: hypothetical protein VLK29_05700 [Luteimonas sp.]|nr:hypothetical protein [Luteimonas sp.]
MRTRTSRHLARGLRLLVLLGGLGAASACTAEPPTRAAAQPAAAHAPPHAVAQPASANAPAHAAAQPRVEGTYAMPAPLVSELRVTAVPGRPGVFRVEVDGGGDPADGAAVGADCQALAEGTLHGDRIEAALLPFESALGGLDPADLADAPRLVLTFRGDQADLEGRFAHCALATRMAGRYQRTPTPRRLVDCPPHPAACWMRD